MNNTDKRWGGKRRPRITMPTPVVKTGCKNLYRVEFVDAEKKPWFSLVLAADSGEAEKIVIKPYSKRQLTAMTVEHRNVEFQYPTYNVRYRGEHQDLLRAKS